MRPEDHHVAAKNKKQQRDGCVCNCIALVSVVSLYTDTIPLQQLQMAVRA